MTQSKTSTTKTSIPGVNKSVRLAPKGGKKRTPLRNNRRGIEEDLQRKVRHIHNLYIKVKEHEQTIKAEYDRAKDEMAIILDELGRPQINCIGTDFNLILKEKANCTYSDDTVRLKHELKCAQDVEKDTGVATKDITLFVSPIIKK